MLGLQGGVYHHTQSIPLQLRLLLYTECPNSPLVLPTHALTTVLHYHTASLQQPCMYQVLGKQHVTTKVPAHKMSIITVNTHPTDL